MLFLFSNNFNSGTFVFRNMNKYYCLILIFLFNLIANTYSKIVPIDLQVDTSQINFSYLVLNQNSNPIVDINEVDFEIYEDFVPISSFGFSRPNPPIEGNLSIIFLLDLSTGNFQINNRNFTLAKNLINGIANNLINAEFSLIAFDSRSYVISDFVSNPSEIASALPNSNTRFGSNFDTAFIGFKVGALFFSDLAKFPRSVVLITDKNRDFNFNEIANIANQKNCRIFTLMIGNSADDNLRILARRTDGGYFEYLTDADSLWLARTIDFISRSGKVAMVNWQTLPACSNLRDELLIYKNFDSISFNIELANSDFPALTANPPFLRFSSVIPSTPKNLDVTITAKNHNIRIDSFKISDPHFTIISGNISSPFVLSKDEPYKLTIQFVPTDSSIVFDSLVIFSDACYIRKINITGGFPNKRPKTRTLKLLHPNCGEKFAIGDTIKIDWEGVLAADVVQLQYSTNNGVTWDTLAVNVLGMEYKWWLDPTKFPESDSCLVRIIQIWPNNAGETVELRHRSSVNIANFNRDASLIITGTKDADEYASIWNPGTGTKLFNLKGHTDQVDWACFDNEDRYALTASDDSSAILWDVKTGDSIYAFRGHTGKVTSANFSLDGLYIVTSGTDGSCFVWDLRSKKIVDTLSFRKNPIYFASFAPDSNFVFFASYDGNVYGYNIKELKITKTYSTKYRNNHIHQFAINLNKRIIAAVSHLGLIFIWDYDTTSNVATHDYKFFLAHDTVSYPAINTAYFNSTGNWLITAGSDGRVLRWNPETGELIDSMAIGEHSNSITSASFSFDDAMLLTSSWDSTAKIFNRTKLGLQIDTSDCPFSIRKTKFVATDVDFGRVPVGTSLDTLVIPFAYNSSSIPLKIKSIEIFGSNSDEFKIIDINKTKSINANDSIIALLNFSPKDIGTRLAFVKFKFDGDSIVKKLTGIGFIPPLEVNPQFVDLGYVELGEFRDTILSFALKNVSTTPVEITKISNIGPDSLNFVIIDGGNPSTLLPNRTKPITVRFTPDTVGRRICLFEFSNNTEVPKAYIQFFAEGIKPVFDSILISVDTFEASPGDMVRIPIKISNQLFQNPNSNYEGIAFDLTFNKSILEPLNKEFESFTKGDNRTLIVKAKNSNLLDSILINLDFKVALGNDTLTPLSIENSYPIGQGKINIKEKSGLLKLSNLCRQGGVRLFDADGRLYLGQNQPNPASEIIAIEFETIETGWTSLDLYDYSGMHSKFLFGEYLKPGKYRYSFDITELTAGIYFYVLKTPNQTLIKTMQIVK